MADPAWNLTTDSAQIKLGNLTGSVDVTRVTLGLGGLCWAGDSMRGWLWGVSFCESQDELSIPTETYVRGNDLCARYEFRDPNDNKRVSVRWTGNVEDSGMPAVELLVSVETDLLDSTPLVATSTALPGGSVWALFADGAAEPLESIESIESTEYNLDELPLAVVVQPEGFSFSYCELLRPGDSQGLTWGPFDDGQVHISHELVGHFLEKGVIRRVQLRGHFLSREGDLDEARRLLAAFHNSPAPLAT